jgi:hypothetical protein
MILSSRGTNMIKIIQGKFPRGEKVNKVFEVFQVRKKQNHIKYPNKK